MSKVFIIDIAKCNGCYNCQLACKDEHAGNDWTPYSRPQPDVGQFWIKIHENVCGTLPKVKIHYIPGQFIAGTVYDPVEEEVIIGARCRMSTGGKFLETITDDYGDFWFDDLAIGRYDLAIEARGYQGKYFRDLYTDKCINLGDIPMDKSV